MGSGGPRGLQILRSGVQSARGGFDSHAFPPLLALLVGAALGWAGLVAPGRAAELPPAVVARDSVLADSARAGPAGVIELPRLRVQPGGVTSGARPARPGAGPVLRESRFDQPRWVMLRSLVIPGWGQLHNRAWLKALGVNAAATMLGLRMLDDGRALDRLELMVKAARRDGDIVRENAVVALYNDRLDQLVGREWLSAGLLTYALLDAYVDAHFRSFELEFRHDPALPQGGAPAGGARLAVRWAF